MAAPSTSLFWQRTDIPGCDHALVDDGAGLRARGTAVAAGPLPYTCHYELATDERWVTVQVAVTVEGGGWQRSVKLTHAAGRWRVTTAERGNLDRAMTAVGRPRPGLPGMEDPERLAEAVDVDLAAVPLFNTLPVRRLGLLEAPAGSTHQLTMAYVTVPGLEVIPSEQTYTTLDGPRVRYRSDTFTAELELDERGFVTRYPGLADRPSGRTP